ncbi:hypothetical protein [Clostridiisalibacter paucivorans]|uniref:hypothetical protein n=1 Tax=Clostridiisalibacter paucivorans TaxID=408753 RepID=UPI00047EDB38|nr:hypothetical protein [Clostridiisalibacter paucivorans]
MYALFLILNDVHMLDEIMEIFYEIGVGATTIDSVGMGKVLIEHNVDIPMFASIRKILEGDKPYNKTIISIIREKNKLNKATEMINKKLNYISKPGIGFMFVVPVLECYGSKIENE